MTPRTPGYEAAIFLLRDVLTASACETLLVQSQALDWRGSASRQGMQATREVARISPPAELEGGFQAVFPQMIGAARFAGLSRERVLLARYDEGGEFNLHSDAAYLRDSGERSLFTILVYLNEDFGGGETEFPDLRRLVRPRPGSALIFGHGHRHRGRPVTRGMKYVLHLFAMYGDASGMVPVG